MEYKPNHIYFKTITLPEEKGKQIQDDLNIMPTVPNINQLWEKYGRYYTESHTVVFPNHVSPEDYKGDVEIDIKLCSTNFDEELDLCNPLFTEAVLFHNGCECTHTDVEDDLFGVWDLEYNNDLYLVLVTYANPTDMHIIQETEQILQTLTYLGWIVETKYCPQGVFQVNIHRRDWHDDITCKPTDMPITLTSTITMYHNIAEKHTVCKKLLENAIKMWNQYPDSIPVT